MVLGVFKYKQNKVPVKPRPAPKQEPVVAPRPAPKQEPMVTPQPAKPVYDSYFAKAGHVFNVTLIGPNEALLEDFLASMQIDLNQLTAKYGIAFYTQDLYTITQTLKAKKHLESCFMDETNLPYVAQSSEQSTDKKDFVYEVSLAGKQENYLGLSVQTLSSLNVMEKQRNDQAVWVLLPEASLSFKIQHYLNEITPYLEKLNCPIYYLIAYFEKKACFRRNQQLDKTFVHSLKQLTQHLPGDNYYVVPIQVYGGLALDGWQSVHEPIFNLNENGYLQYQPMQCDIPFLLLVQEQKDLAFFNNNEGNRLWSGLVQGLQAQNALLWQVRKERQEDEKQE